MALATWRRGSGLAGMVCDHGDNRPIHNYLGNGKQVRDVLFIEDLTELFLALARNIGRFSGETFNVGGARKYYISAGIHQNTRGYIRQKIPYGFGDARGRSTHLYIRY